MLTIEIGGLLKRHLKKAPQLPRMQLAFAANVAFARVWVSSSRVQLFPQNAPQVSHGHGFWLPG
jgi:hypothetical protein